NSSFGPPSDRARFASFPGQGIFHRSASGTAHGQNIYKNPHFREADPHLPDDNFLYFFHPDHLGSSSYITDTDGELFQHLQYFPSGETWVAEKSNTQRTPYWFSGKELDEDTGLYYFGARYYDPQTSLWLGADPAFVRGDYFVDLNN